jgi:undecaprenyl-diphosphatase
MPIEQIIVLAVIQGVTEFLPISSSGHLILVPALTGWRDQGLITDVMVHMGSLLAVVVYFWRDVLRLAHGTLELLRGRFTNEGRIALLILLGTIPSVLLGLYLKQSGLGAEIRGPLIVAINAIVFGILMYVADRFGAHRRVMEQMTLPSAVIIGLAQAMALIPGTSRSGVTMTAARALGFTRPESARFSFLLGLPAVTGAGILVLGEAISAGETISRDAVLTGVLTFFTALASIAFLMAVIRRYSLTMFVVYRIALGLLLLWMIHTGWLPAVNAASP